MSTRTGTAWMRLMVLSLLVLAAPGYGQEPPTWRITDDGWANDWPDWSPDGELILFESNPASGSCDLYVIPATGGWPATQITFLPGTDDCGFGPAWSPNMDYIAYSTNRDGGNYDIWVMPWPAGEDEAIQLTFHAGLDLAPTWSPDGNQIAFTSTRSDGGGDIWVMPFPGGETESVMQLTTYPGFDGFPSWSPDGNLIAFASNRVPEIQIWVVAPTGGDPVQITTLGGTEPDYHPSDPNLLAYRFSQPDDHDNYDLWLLNEVSPGSDASRVQLTDNLTRDIRPTWSPTGCIAFLSERDVVDSWEIYGMLYNCPAVSVPGDQGTPPVASIQHYPNPLKPSTTFRIRTHVPVREARLLLFDTGGRLVRTIPLGDRPASDIEVLWDGRDSRDDELPSGAYFYRLAHSDGVSETNKAILIR